MRYEAFGWASARLDDLLNLPAARLAAGLIGLGAATTGASFQLALTSCRDAPKHASPNAGWPEAAMAGALGLRLGGPRAYGSRQIEGAWLGSGRVDANSDDIRRALQFFRRADLSLWSVIAGAATLLPVLQAVR